MKSVSIGDILWVENFEQLIEIVGFDDYNDSIKFWSSSHPKEVGTPNCRVSDSWIIFKYGKKLGTL